MTGAEMAEAKRAWETADPFALALPVLGDERLTVGESTEPINIEPGYPGQLRFPPLHAPDIRYLLGKMLDAGKVDRVRETFRNKLRYRYFRAVGAGEAVA